MPAKLISRQFALTLPDFAAMSDADLSMFLAMQDGLWHSQTKAAMKRFQTTSVELNNNWADEYHAWRCPACHREKKDIFRKTETGTLKACLEIHHDHLADYVKDELRRLFGIKWSYAVSRVNRHIDWVAASLAVRFSEALVCSDCNEVDSRIKSRVADIDRHFSYSPLEIASCIAPQPNSSHRINFAVAEQVWMAAKPDFEDRKSLVNVILEKVKAGGLRREEVSLVSPLARSSITSSQLLYRFAGEDVTDFLGGAVSTIVKRSVTKGEASKKAKRRRVVVPTKEDLAQLVYGNGASKKWNDALASWSCPVCERSKVEVARQSNSKKWFAGIYEHIEWFGVLLDDEPDIDRHERINICADCSEVFSELMRKKPALSESFLTCEQIRKVIIELGPHRTHDIDWDEATRLATENQRWEKSKERYWPRYRRAKALKSEFDEIQRKRGLDDNAALDALARSVRHEYPNSEWHEILTYLHYALEDAKRWPDR